MAVIRSPVLAGEGPPWGSAHLLGAASLRAERAQSRCVGLLPAPGSPGLAKQFWAVLQRGRLSHQFMSCATVNLGTAAATRPGAGDPGVLSCRKEGGWPTSAKRCGITPAARGPAVPSQSLDLSAF